MRAVLCREVAVIKSLSVFVIKMNIFETKCHVLIALECRFVVTIKLWFVGLEHFKHMILIGS